MKKKKVAILGSTGSIGTQALEVIAMHPDFFHYFGWCVFNRQVRKDLRQARKVIWEMDFFQNH